MQPIDTQYAKCGELHIAYQISGDGPIDLVFVPGVISHLEHQWEEHHQASFFRRLGSFSRLIRFDKRGQGLSDRVHRMPSIEERMDDVLAVMEAVGIDQAAMLALSEGGPMAIVFAATHPDRVSKLILWNTFARIAWAPGVDEETRDKDVEARMHYYRNAWGTADLVDRFIPSLAKKPSFRTWWSRFERLSMSPGAAKEAMQVNFDIDIRSILNTVNVPTLVIRNENDHLVARPTTEHLVNNIPRCQYVEVPGDGHFDWEEKNGVTDEIQAFLTGERNSGKSDRILTSILFTDIVGSTDRLAKIGDQRWRELLDQHDDIIDHALNRFDGDFINTTGDGVQATFPGPGRAINCAKAIIEAVKNIGLELRAGIHTGEVELRSDQLAGLTVHTAARISSIADADEILVSKTVKDLIVGSGISLADHGTYTLKGVPGDWQLFKVV